MFDLLRNSYASWYPRPRLEGQIPLLQLTWNKDYVEEEGGVGND